MAFGRRKRGSLLQTAARTAVITGTAAATSNAVHSRAAQKQAAQQQAAQQQTAQQQTASLPPQAAPVAEVPTISATPVQAATGAGSVSTELIDQLTKLGELHAAGVLTDDEFAQLKAKAIG